jgi:hypothetical protein
VAPRIDPSYGVPRDGSGAERLPWGWAVERLVAARTYWLCTVRADGRAHAAPVWGLWLQDAVWVSTGRASVKARNLARDRRAVCHLDSGVEAVILEGELEEVAGVDELAPFLDAYEAKYDLRPDLAALDALVLRLAPQVALTWDERDYSRTATRWLFR